MKNNKKHTEKPIFEEDKYDELAELLSKKAQLLKDCDSIQITYMTKFGEQLIKNFELKLECIKLKKSISYCRRMLNRGLPINVESMKEAVDKEVTVYKVELQSIQNQLEMANDATTVDAYSVSRAKKIYRRLCKLIHPDVNAKTEKNETLRELWQKILEAYRTSNVEELENLEILVKKALEDLGGEGFEIDIDRIDKRIEKVERAIYDITTSEPYVFKDYIRDKESIESYKNQLEDEYRDYEEYHETLKKALNEILLGKGINTTWELN